MAVGKPHPNYAAVYFWLLGLMSLGIAASFLPGGRAFAIVVIFTIAFVKSLLVAANFMHLRFEPVVIYAFVLIPLLFLVVLAAALFPDFVWRSFTR